MCRFASCSSNNIICFKINGNYRQKVFLLLFKGAKHAQWGQIFFEWILNSFFLTKLRKTFSVIWHFNLQLKQIFYTKCKKKYLTSRWVLVVEFHDPTLGIGKVFDQESTVVKWNYQNLCLHPVIVHQKLGMILVIKWFKNWNYQ